MKISAQVHNQNGQHRVALNTDNQVQSIEIAPKSNGLGSSINGGELLFLALATCFCNDIYREAAKHEIEVRGVEVEVTGEFGQAGEPAKNVSYRVKITASHATKDEVKALIEHTDRVTEIQNTLRTETPVILDQTEVNVFD